METTDTAPIEELANVSTWPGGSGSGLSQKQIEDLSAELDERRVKTKPGGGSKKYLAEHDVIRNANRIFGFGNWGTEVIVNECIGAHNIENSKGEKGWQVGYRCTVRLAVKGCQPVDGCGYGDAFEKQWSGVITAHELAYKEAESDAIKRAFKKWGDQFGLILYAKAEDLKLIEEQKAEEELDSPASEAEIAEVMLVAKAKGQEDAAHQYFQTKTAVEGAVKHRHTMALLNRLERLPDANGTGTEQAAIEHPVAAAPAVAPEEQAAVEDRAASVEELKQVGDIANRLGGDKLVASVKGLIKDHMTQNGSREVSALWLGKLTDHLLKNGTPADAASESSFYALLPQDVKDRARNDTPGAITGSPVDIEGRQLSTGDQQALDRAAEEAFA